ncbi:MAG: ribosome silencing factor [Planctomycetota bacterium]|nr:ribosome silencing factor [Planctomycetota bacterium]
MSDFTTSDQERQIALQCGRLAVDRKARSVRLLYVGDRIPITGFFLLATVNNNRHARAVRDAIRLESKEHGWGVPRAASEDPEGRWSLYDYGGIIVHLFDEEGREYFDLDGLWADVPEVDIESGEWIAFEAEERHTSEEESL